MFFEGGIDYIPGPYTVIFPAGITIASFDVSVANDNILETNEMFNLFIIPTSLPERVTIGNIGRSLLTIVDNDSKWFSLTSDSGCMFASSHVLFTYH